MRGVVRVWNMHEDGWGARPGPDGKGDYIGRPSILGNPWVVNRPEYFGRTLLALSREQAVERYRQWLWEIVKAGLAGQLGPEPAAPPTLGKQGTRGREQEPEIRQAVWWAVVRLAQRLLRGEDLDLVCYCAPKLCHGDVQRSCLDYLVSVHASVIEKL